MKRGDGDEIEDRRWRMESLSGGSLGRGVGNPFCVCNDSMDGKD
jgi:hypothetical protein